MVRLECIDVSVVRGIEKGTDPGGPRPKVTCDWVDGLAPGWAAADRGRLWQSGRARYHLRTERNEETRDRLEGPNRKSGSLGGHDLVMPCEAVIRIEPGLCRETESPEDPHA